MAESFGATTCPYCGTGCGLLVKVEDGRVKEVKGDPQSPINQGKLCLLGATIKTSLYEGRLLHPQVRAGISDSFQQASWEDAIALVAEKFKAVMEEHGPEAIAFYASGQLLTEDLYVLSKLARIMGASNVDANSRLCMASAALGYKTSLGEDAPPACYEDIEHTDCFLIAGSNTAECHPVLFKRIAARKRMNPRVKVIVADPRRTKTAEIADLHLQIKPGSDVALYNAMLHVLFKGDLLDRDFIAQYTGGFEDVEKGLEEYTPEKAAAITGLEPEAIRKAALLYGRAEAALSLWTMGLNQSSSGVAKNNSIINLSLATGNVGKPGAGPFSLTGQCNAMGLRMTGTLAHLLPGHRLVANEAHRRDIARLWGIDEEELNPKPGLSAVELFQALERGDVKAIWICATNPAVSLPDLNTVEKALKKAELVVVQDAYFNETTRHAHVLLPAAQWPEKEGTMTNSERRVSYLKALAAPPGEAKPDLEIFRLFAEKAGYAEYFNYSSPEEVFEEFKKSTEGKDLDMMGMSYERLQSQSLQWPCPSPKHSGTKRLYSDFRFPTPNGKANFIFHHYKPPEEKAGSTYPLVLLTGRVESQWHSRTRTAKIPALNRAGPSLAVSEEDAGRLGIESGEMVEMRSSRGRVVLPAEVDSSVPMGAVFLSFHWGGSWSKSSAANLLTNPVFDSASKEPEYKACAVRIAKVME